MMTTTRELTTTGGLFFKTVLANVQYAINTLGLYKNIEELNEDLGLNAVKTLVATDEEKLHNCILSTIHTTKGFIFSQRENLIPNITPINFMISNLAWQIMYDRLEVYVDNSEYYECVNMHEKVPFIYLSKVYADGAAIENGRPVVMDINKSTKVIAYVNMNSTTERYMDIYVKYFDKDLGIIVRSLNQDLPASKDLYDAIKSTGILEKKDLDVTKDEQLISSILR